MNKLDRLYMFCNCCEDGGIGKLNVCYLLPVVKACIGCKGVTETLVEEELPDLHMGESEVSDVTAPAHDQT